MIDAKWNTAFPLRFGPDAQRPLALSLTLKDDLQRPAVEAFIQDRFATVHQADVHHFMPELLALRDRQHQLSAAVGARIASAGPLFVEQYLPSAVEQVVSRLAGKPVERGHIVEVGNLAARNAGSARLIIVAMTWLLARHGLEWVVFTGAATLINSFQRLGLEPLLLCEADPEKLGGEQQAWGRYYAQHPNVFAGNIRLGLEQLEISGVLARLGFPFFERSRCHAA
ncbi:thermostable hemolysin [Pseudomonas turukhanskensis]|uniref:Thermostable hemolysin n=1 Tax=Pseudomonas turukhanskensis TaxID=1806536 RepID=A0A9W6K5Q1_9PSED|nr:thermostable hemolysin [Pseudomonas turukhanskensis]GLK88484.1 thermostable hemolysin [Pseudomonas turukhanskensis]